MKAYLWSTNDGNASWTVSGCQGHRQGTKPASGKIANFSSSFLILILVKTFVPRQLICGCTCRYCSINNTNKLRLLVSMYFWVKKESTGGRVSSKKHCTGSN